MKRTGFKPKPTKPLKRTAFKKSSTKTPIKRKSAGKAKNAPNIATLAPHQTTKQIKKEIQALLREICILRDGKCILYGKRCYHEYGKDKVVWQAEHLIERSNSLTYGDSRLVVLVCKNCHGWKHFKKSNHDQYDEWVRETLSPERIKIWDRCIKEKWQANKVDWQLVKLSLKQDLERLKNIKS